MKRFFITGGLAVILLGVIVIRIFRHSHSQGLSVGIVTTQCGSGGDDVTNRWIRLLIHDDGSLFINEDPVSAGQLACRLRAIYDTRNERILFVDGGNSLPYQQAIDAIDIARSAEPDLRILLITPSTRRSCLFDLEYPPPPPPPGGWPAPRCK
jgi:biopolymer transport protein ExbD